MVGDDNDGWRVCFGLNFHRFGFGERQLWKSDEPNTLFLVRCVLWGVHVFWGVDSKYGIA